MIENNLSRVYLITDASVIRYKENGPTLKAGYGIVIFDLKSTEIHHEKSFPDDNDELPKDNNIAEVLAVHHGLEAVNDWLGLAVSDEDKQGWEIVIGTDSKYAKDAFNQCRDDFFVSQRLEGIAGLYGKIRVVLAHSFGEEVKKTIMARADILAKMTTGASLLPDDHYKKPKLHPLPDEHYKTPKLRPLPNDYESTIFPGGADNQDPRYQDTPPRKRIKGLDF